MSKKPTKTAKRGDLIAVCTVHSATALNGPTTRWEQWGLYKVTGVNLQGICLRAERPKGCPSPLKVHPFPERSMVADASTVGGDVDAAIRAIYASRTEDFRSVTEAREALLAYLAQRGLPIPKRAA